MANVHIGEQVRNKRGEVGIVMGFDDEYINQSIQNLIRVWMIWLMKKIPPASLLSMIIIPLKFDKLWVNLIKKSTPGYINT